MERLIPIKVHQDEKGPLCADKSGSCRFRRSINNPEERLFDNSTDAGRHSGFMCNARNKFYCDELTNDRPGPWCPVWYGESREVK